MRFFKFFYNNNNQLKPIHSAALDNNVQFENHLEGKKDIYIFFDYFFFECYNSNNFSNDPKKKDEKTLNE